MWDDWYSFIAATRAECVSSDVSIKGVSLAKKVASDIIAWRKINSLTKKVDNLAEIITLGDDILR